MSKPSTTLHELADTSPLLRLKGDKIQGNGTYLELNWDTLGETPLPEQEFFPEPGALISGRYILKNRLSKGSFGSVWSAIIKGTEAVVAVKMVHALSTQDLAIMRREVAALRWARLPGVVRLLDDGSVGADYFIVMEYLQGAHFPGRSGQQPWSAVAAPTQQLLESLARLHHAGLIHRDLKPANIMVDSHGRPTVIDLGIAAGRALRHSLRDAYTPAYAAPEQILGQTCDARTDLYAVGVMLYEMLSGRLPHILDLRARAVAPPPPIATVAPDVPPAVGAVIDRLLSPTPGDRPASALAVLQALGGRLPLLLGGGGLSLPDRPQPARALWALFHGPDHFFHLREDAADELWARTAGVPAAVEAELGAWLRAGLGHWEDGAVRIDRVAIERLQSGLRLSLTAPQPPASADEATVLGLIELAWPAVDRDLVHAAAPLGAARTDAALDRLRAAERVWSRADGRLSCRVRVEPAAEWPRSLRQQTHAALARHSAPTERLRHLIAADASAATLLAEARALARQHIEAGALHRVLAPLELGLTLARRLQDAAAEIDLLILWALWGLGQETGAALERALYEIERIAPVPPPLQPVHTLLKAHQYALDRRLEHALELLDGVPPFADERLEIERVTVRVAAARRVRGTTLDEEEGLLDGLASWAAAGSADRRGKLLGWRGNLEYRRSRYVQAARLHQRAAENKSDQVARVSSLMNAASALLEAMRFEDALTQAEQAARAAHAIRHTQYEALTTWILRTIAHRSGTPLPADTTLVDAAAIISPYIHALFAMAEASSAWRSAQLQTAQVMAQRARQVFSQPPQSGLLRALELATGAPPDAGELDALFQAALCAGADDFAVQILGLLRRVEDRPEWLRAAQDCASRLPPQQRSIRLDILSVEECLQPLPHEPDA